MKTIVNLVLFIVLIIVVVVLSGGSFRDLKDNGTKVVNTTINLVDSGMEKLDDLSEDN